MNTLKEFMNTDTINTSSLSGNYIIRTDSTTGIDTLTVAGEEGFHSQMMITDSEQLQKLQDLADVYKQKYPNVVTSSEAALNFARGEVLGFNFQTPNGIMIANQTGMIYMDDKNPDNDWGISYDQSADTYNKVIVVLSKNALDNLESFDDWKQWFEDNNLSYDKVLTDEELAKLLTDRENET